MTAETMSGPELPPVPTGFRGALHLVRHGESGANRDGELVGRRDVPLTTKGEVQARAAALLTARISSGRWRIVSSPLRRAMQTAEAIADVMGGVVVVDDRFVELDYGDLEGAAFADLLPDWPPAWIADPSVPTPNGESTNELLARVFSGIRDNMREVVALDLAGLVIVTHLGPIKGVTQRVLGLPDADAGTLFVSPASLSTVRAWDEAWEVERWNVHT